MRRIYEHKNKLVKGFTQKYNVERLVYYEACENIIVAIEREKQIKAWSRKKKNDLIRVCWQLAEKPHKHFFSSLRTALYARYPGKKIMKATGCREQVAARRRWDELSTHPNTLNPEWNDLYPSLC